MNKLAELAYVFVSAFPNFHHFPEVYDFIWHKEKLPSSEISMKINSLYTSDKFQVKLVKEYVH